MTDTDYLRLTLVQPDIVWEDSAANLLHYTRLVQHVQTDVLVLPEMFNTGFTMNAAA
ncbi:nitrilase family protein, partial [Sphingobacteriales bacterium UPWRP_1]